MSIPSRKLPQPDRRTRNKYSPEYKRAAPMIKGYSSRTIFMPDRSAETAVKMAIKNVIRIIGHATSAVMAD